ncbi:preprotein translocase subunit YajC [Corynebacterium sp.]|uniref:preprotein translocase subunit YajC n=1 Tax=Corynebacterium sp. TaxID=1720 RepID=UPI0027B9D6DF|nr:preprotein translocase subunit YajC [Corynebacterium sp.]
MDILLIFGLLALFLLPSFFMMRKQRKQQDEMRSFQQALQPGDRVISAGGIHLVLTEIGETSVTGEVASGVEVTMEKIAILRPADQVSPAQNSPAVPESVNDGVNTDSGNNGEQEFPNHPENDNRNS